MRNLVLVNPGSRNGSDVEETMRRHFDPHDRVVRTGHEGHAAELARGAAREGFDRVVAAGGDGTVHEVVNGLRTAGASIQLGVVPVGTGNDFARSLRLPLDLEASLALLARGRTRSIDLVRAERDGGERRWVANMAAGGFGAEARDTLTSELKESWGPFAFFRAALRHLPERSTYRVELGVMEGDPWVEVALSVAVANGSFVAGGIPAAPYAELDDGVFDLVLVKDCGLASLTALAPSVLLGRHLEGAEDCILFRQARRVRVRSDRPLPWNLDGEPFVDGDLAFEIEPGALEVVVGEGK
jgi:diacylglycerol kinase (ATP)